MDDAKRVMLIKTDPEAGMAGLMDDHMGLVCSIVRGRLGGVCTKEDIEDCVSEVFAEFYRGINNFSPEKGTVKALLCSIAKHRAASICQKASRAAGNIPLDEAGNELPGGGPSAEELAAAKEKRRKLITAVEALGEPDRSIIVRKYYLCESSKSIADRLSMTVSAVDTRAHRALGKLKKVLEGINDE